MTCRLSEYCKIAIIFLLLLISCKNEVDVDNKNESPLLVDFGVDEARTWFNARVYKQEKLKVKSVYSVDNLSLDIDWNLGQVNSNAEYVAVEVPWIYQNASEEFYSKGMSSFNSIDRLVVLKSLKSDSIFGFRMIILPTENYSQFLDSLSANNYLSRTLDLDGMVLFFDLDGCFVNGWLYDCGVISAALFEFEKLNARGSSRTKSASISYKYVEVCTTSYAGMVYEDEEIIVPVTNCRTKALTEFSSTSELTKKTIDYGGEIILAGGGGSSDTNNEDFDKSVVEPCDFLASVKLNNSLNQWVIENMARAVTSDVETGYCKCIDGTCCYPSYSTSTALSYGNKLAGCKYTERVHMHPDKSGGAAIPSVGDLNVLYNMLVTGKIADVATFNYVIVSSTGTLVLNIVDEAAFKKFCVDFEIELGVKGKYSGVYLHSELYKTYDPDQFGDEVARFFSELNAGLSCIYGLPTANGSVEWNVKQVNADRSVSNLNCK
jgi:hypothetical protein